METGDPTDLSRALEIGEEQIRNIIRFSLEKKAKGTAEAAQDGHFRRRVLEIDEEEIRNSIRERLQAASKIDNHSVSSFTGGRRKEVDGGGGTEESYSQTLSPIDGNASTSLLSESEDSEEESNGGEIMDEDSEEVEVTTEADMAGGGEVEDNNEVDWRIAQEQGGDKNASNMLSISEGNAEGEQSLEEGFDASLEEGEGWVGDGRGGAGETMDPQTIRKRMMALERETDEIEEFDPEEVEENLKRLEGHFRGGFRVTSDFKCLICLLLALACVSHIAQAYIHTFSFQLL